ncbi:DUF4893 domain-containing protein [Jannaschia sp. S6380]|uniref:DUF4893 domain-containing protein n=1 Tax=Jannaschia sp. S6380 TaxID=2926408 RepID=UPI001FF4C974|nr:DUF4893 domain-containing protein [Jannaschia sp. S6380]MCK0167545.1 DUF4893 domain-containing protein [Jannaschia sp. S6380]
MMRHVLALLAALLIGPAVQADELRAPDVTRLTELDVAFGQALRQALAMGDSGDVAVLTGALTGPAMSIATIEPAGDWSCRTMKMGELLPLVVYRPFRCRIAPAGAGRWRIDKLTGSQRLAGHLQAATDGRVVYRGVGHVGDGPAVAYADLPPIDQTPVEPNQTHAQVGLFEQMSRDRARLLLPAPILESGFDILYLTR